MENQVFMPITFGKHIKALIKQDLKTELKVLTNSSNDKTLNLLAKKTKKCNIEKRISIILTHADEF